MIHVSPVPPVDIPDLPLTPFVLGGLDAHRDQDAFIDASTGARLTYAALDDRIRRLAGGLLAAGMAKGEVLAIMAPNCPEYGVVFHAVAMAGGVVTTVNPTYTAGEVPHLG